MNNYNTEEKPTRFYYDGAGLQIIDPENAHYYANLETACNYLHSRNLQGRDKTWLVKLTGWSLDDPRIEELEDRLINILHRAIDKL